jgi:hypothetical protein
MLLCGRCRKILEISHNFANPQDEAICTRCGAEHWVCWSAGEISIASVKLKTDKEDPANQ